MLQKRGGIAQLHYSVHSELQTSTCFGEGIGIAGCIVGA